MSTPGDRRKRLQRFAKLPKLAGARPPKRPTSAAVETAVKQLANRMKRAGESGRVQFQLTSKGQVSDWTAVSMAETGTKAIKGTVDRPDLKIILSEEEGWDLLCGKASPVEILLRGKMRIVGDCGLAKRLYRSLGTRGETEIA